MFMSGRERGIFNKSNSLCNLYVELHFFKGTLNKNQSALLPRELLLSLNFFIITNAFFSGH